MKVFVIYALIISTFVISAAAQNTRFSNALESQISCEQTLNPAKAVRALQKSNIIQKNYYVNSDSVSYFKANKSLLVWGFKVYSVFGFAQDSKVFKRGPGTAPPITLGVVVPYSVAKVKAKLKDLGFINVIVEKSEYDESGNINKSRILTEIYCTSGF